MIPKDRSVLITNLVVHCCTSLNKKIDMLKYKIVPIIYMTNLRGVKCSYCINNHLAHNDHAMTLFCNNTGCPKRGTTQYDITKVEFEDLA